MAHYFTREEAESLLPQISIVLLQIQDHYQVMQQKEDALGALHAQAMGNGHHLHTRINKLQKELEQLIAKARRHKQTPQSRTAQPKSEGRAKGEGE